MKTFGIQLWVRVEVPTEEEAKVYAAYIVEDLKTREHVTAGIDEVTELEDEV